MRNPFRLTDSADDVAKRMLLEPPAPGESHADRIQLIQNLYDAGLIGDESDWGRFKRWVARRLGRA